MSLLLAFGTIAAAGAVIGLVSWVALRMAGAQPALARRLAGPREVRVGQLLDAADVPERPVRVAGRIRCRDPLEMRDGERLVAFHRDVDVVAGGRWRSVERLRETRSFELWDHDGSLTVDPAAAAEPLVVIPKVWRGDPADLEEPHTSAVARLVERHGPATNARSVIRTVDVTDRPFVVARAIRGDDGRVRLEPPPGGFVITTLAIPDAMRLLGGPRRRLAALSVVGLGFGLALAVIGVIGALVAAVL
ncbi:MAG TPA: hypothetical protein VNO82_03700 [Solirubrobacteraceae bacterium]|nr:hypothetical protein [Solirubrobacteraceae bacterium]